MTLAVHKRRLHWKISAAIGGVAFFLFALIYQAPANLFAIAVGRACNDRCRLLPNGSIWHGNGRLYYAEASGWRPLTHLRWAWRSSPPGWDIVAGQGSLALNLLTGPTIEFSLVNLGLPFAAVAPGLLPTIGNTGLGGQLVINGKLRCVPGCDGQLAIQANDIRSDAIAPHPLGSYQVHSALVGNIANIQATTLAGPLYLAGSGKIDSRKSLHFGGEVWTSPTNPALDRFLAPLGQRTDAGRIAFNVEHGEAGATPR